MPRPASAVSGVRDDGHGLLLVSVRVTNDKWDAALAARSGGAITPQLDSMRMRATDIYFEVIDVNAGVVLASSGPMPGERVVKESVRGWFRLGWAGYRLAEDADGLPVVKMMEVRLKGR